MPTLPLLRSWRILRNGRPTTMPRLRRWGNVAERRRKLAGYEVAGNLSMLFVRPERTTDSAVPPGRFLLRRRPDTPCLANFRLSLWDEASPPPALPKTRRTFPLLFPIRRVCAGHPPLKIKKPGVFSPGCAGKSGLLLCGNRRRFSKAPRKSIIDWRPLTAILSRRKRRTN